VSILGWQTETAHEWMGCQIYPSEGRLGGDALYPLLVRRRPDVVVALADVWWLPYFTTPHIRRQMEMTGAPWALYFPIDGHTADERLPQSWIDLLAEVDIPIAMSRYGQAVARNCGISCDYIPHGVDLDVFTPPSDRVAAKRALGVEGRFVVLSDSRNQPRKMIPRLIDAFAAFAQDRADAILHLHTDPDDPFCRTILYSYDVRADIAERGLGDKVRFTPGMVMSAEGGVPLAELAALYQAADVHLLASSGEGFGLPTLQAAAAGAVPLAGDYSASAELVAGHGEAIAISDWTENEFGVRRGFIDTADAAARLAGLHGDRAMLAARSNASRAFAEPYGWERVLDQWEDLLASVAPGRRGVRRAPSMERDRAERLIPSIAGLPLGASVRVNLVEREFGRLEAAIGADARARASDVKIPTVPRASVVDGVKALRRPGQVGLALADRALFLRLRAVFPLLSAWTPAPPALADPEGAAWQGAEVTALGVADPRDARLHAAQSVLLLDVHGALPSAILFDAALLGAPCVGQAGRAEQETLWPDLAAADEDAAFTLARRMLTDAAFAARVQAYAAGQVRSDADEADIAAWLRRLSAAEHAPAMAAT
jgi:glycosyltransferase involved in cell wall biosynthesis